MIWPSAPMLNSPARKARATARPAATSGVPRTSVSVIGRTACVNESAPMLKTDPSNRAM